MEVCMKRRSISLLVSVDQRAGFSHVGKRFAEACLAYNNKNYIPLRKSEDKCAWKCLRLASYHIGRTLVMRFVLFLIAVASDVEQDLDVKPCSPFLCFRNMLFHNSFSAHDHARKPSLLIV